jgi:hypothetical protein
MLKQLDTGGDVERAIAIGKFSWPDPVETLSVRPIGSTRILDLRRRISIAQSEAGIEPNGVTSDVRRKSMACEGNGSPLDMLL